MSSPRDASSDEDDFNPGLPSDEVDREDEQEAAPEDDQEPQQRRHDDDEDDEEDDDEDEDEEDDDDDVQGSRPRKRRRDLRNAFFEIEAEVDDEDEAEDDEADGEEIRDFIDNSHPDDLDVTARLDDDRRHRELDRHREMEESMDAEKQAEMYRERYGKRQHGRGLADSNIVPRRLMLPSVEDPGVWAVKCKEGKEREVIFSIMKKVEESLNTNQELGITSAFERGGTESVMKGIIYVEAARKNDVLIALDGMLNVYPHTKIHLVDIKEMPDLLRVRKSDPLMPGAWVRLRRPPKHNGDLAQVIDVTDNGLEARVRFIPRLDYGGHSGGSMFGKRKRPPFGAGPRPPQKLFSEAEAKKHDPRSVTGNPQTNTWMYKGDEFENGFQVKDIKIQLLQTTDVNPSLEEVTKFASNSEDGTENLDLGALAEMLKNGSQMVAYVPGDMIEVYDGEQKGVVGRATHVTGDIVTLSVTEGILKGQSIDVPTKCLRKKFNLGDHVKVIGGSRYRDEVGMVVKISQDTVTILSDQSNSEITVFSKDLREASDIGGQGSLGQYSLLDLVAVDHVTVGCIVKVDRESLGILDQNGDVRQMMPSQIANKLPKRKTAVAADRNGSEIRVDDVVKEYVGLHRQGKIIHIHRSFVFLHSNESKENAGVFVVKATNVTTVAAKGGRITGAAQSAGPDLSSMNPALQRNPNGGKQMAPPKVMGRDRSIGQTVHVKKGGYKGMLGIVKDATDTHVRLELHSKNKTITLPKDHLIFKDKHTGERIDITRRGGPPVSRGGPGGASTQSRDPWQGGRTPSSRDSSRTPAWSGGSTSYGSNSRTPAWSRADGGRTPAWDGSRTSYGGANGARTPAWASGAKTPAYDAFATGSKTPAYGGSDSWNSGSKTPGYGASAATPGDSWAYTPSGSGGSGAYDAPTPGAGLLGAPTPGAALNAPTPGVYSAPTPGAYSAPTPAAVSAPTPGAWQSSSWQADSAPTPAAGAPTPGAYYGAPTPAAAGPSYADDD